MPFCRPGAALTANKRLIDELQHHGVLLDVLAEELAQEKGDGSSLQGADPFDVLLHVAYDQPILTRSERAQRAKRSWLTMASMPNMVKRPVKSWMLLIDKYADEGISRH